MDNKSFFRALMWGMLVFFAWQIIASRIWPPVRPTPTPAATATSASPETAGVPGAPAEAEPPAGSFVAKGAETSQTLTLGDVAGGTASPFRMQVMLDSRGASIEKLLLSDHPLRAGTKDRYALVSPMEIAGKTWRSYALELVTMDGAHPVALDTLPWRVERADTAEAQVARFLATIERDGAPVIELERRYTLPQQSSASGRSDLFVDLIIRNVAPEQHQVIVRELGPIGLPTEGSVLPDQKIFAAEFEAGVVRLRTKTFVDIVRKTDRKVYPLSGATSTPLLWWGASNLFFTFTVSPPAVAQTPEPILLNEGAVVEGVDFDGDKETKTDVTSRFTSRPITIPPAGSTTLAAQVYAGAKNREAFQSIANADYLGREYMQQIREGYGSCTFSFLTDGMIWLLNKLERIFNNFGVAIIVLVLIVRTILHPITKRTQVNMMRMQQNMASVQPKMDELRKRFANEPLKLNQEMMKLYREEGISPVGQMGGCLPMLLQMPILFALYSSLRNNVAMRGRGFILWINDLTAPDVLVDFGRTIHIPLLGDMTGLHLLPILVGVMMFAQQKLMPKPKRPVKQSSSAQAEQMEQMQKIMPYMSLIMIPVFYKLASGLNIYMMATSIIGMLEQWQIRKHISKEELKAPVHKPKPDKPRRGMAFFEKIMKQAEEAQKLKSNRDPRNKK